MNVLKEKVFNNVRNRLIAIVTIVVLFVGAIPGIFIDNMVFASGVDVSDSSEILFDHSGYNFIVSTDDNTFPLQYNNENNTYNWPSNLSVTSVTEISGRLSFSLADSRTQVDNNTYFIYKLPDVFSVSEVSSKPVMINVSGTEISLGNYSISNNEIRMDFQSELLGKEGINISNVTIPFIADIDKTKLGDNSDNTYAIEDPNTGDVTYIEIPDVPTELTSIAKKATLNDDNSVTWTITLGEDVDAGVSLAGATIQEVLDGNQDIVTAYIGDDEDDTVEFVQDEEDNNLYTYTFPTNSSLTAPATMTVITNPKDSVINSLAGVNSDVELNNTVNYIAYGHDESEALTASDSTKIVRTALNKAGTVIDGNTIEWNLDLNNNHANVYGATVADPLSSGLTIDESYGIIITDKEENGEKVTLTSTKKSDRVGSVNVSYDIEEEDGKQTIKVDFGTFNHEYDICFRTTVSNDSFKGDAQVENIAHVDVRYPKGSGKGGSSSIEYGSPNVNMNFYNSHIKIEGISESDASSTGILNWKATPSTKMEANDYTGGVMTLTIMEGQSFTGSDASSLKVYDENSDDLISTGYSASVTGNVLTINFDSTVNLNDIYVTFDTRADTYFGDDSKHTYEAKADIRLSTATDGFYTAQQSSARQILQNSMVTKSVATSYDDDNKKALFIFKIKINNKGLPLTNVVLSDNLSGIFRYTDAENIDSKGNIISSDSDPRLDNGDYEIVSVTSDNDGIVTYDDAEKSATVSYSNLNTSDTVTIELDLTNQGKEKLKLGGELSEKAVYAVNEATVKAKELDEDGITGSVKGLAGSQVASNKVAIKNGAQEKAGGNYTADIDWIVDINSMGASLGANPIIFDTIPNGLTLDKSSVKLYLAKHADNGTTINGKKGDALSLSSYSFSAVKEKDGTTVLTVNLPNSSEYANSSFRLQYTTSMSGGVNTYSNELDINVDGNTKDVTGTVVGKNISYGYGTIRSFLTMTKTDALSSSIKVKGAKYGVFETEAYALTGDESKTVDVGYTDENGKYTFTVPGELHDINAKTYYVRELEAPNTSDGNGGGYALDENVYTISGVTYGKHTIGPDGIDSVKAFTDERQKDLNSTGNVSITNTFINDTVGGNVSQFKLYVIPYGTEKKEVSLNKTDDGTYTFNQYASGTTIAGAPSEINGDNSVSGIAINNLPWGTYKLVQTVPANGYIKASEISFVVSQQDGGCVVTGTTNVNNEKTCLVVKDNVSSDYVLSENGTNRTWELDGNDLITGKELVNELIQGKSYTLTQKTVPDGYKKHDNIAINNFNGNQTINITESPIVGNVIVKNQDGDVISDVNLSMKDNTDTTLSGSSITLNGKVNVSGSYEITGTLPAKYMPIDEEKVTLTVNDKGTGFSVSSTNNSVMSAAVLGTTVTITVQEIRSKVEITEVSEDNEDTIIYGGTYTLYNADNDSVVSGYSNITNVDGIDIDYLTIGNYYLKQNSAPNAYGIIDATKRYEFSVDSTSHNSVIPVRVKNHPLPGTINVTKTSSDGNKSLEGAVYKLYTRTGDNYVEVATGITDENGRMTFDNLLWDTYYLKEIKAPKGYQLDTTIHGAWTINAETPDQTLNKTVSDSATSVRIKTQGINILDGKDVDEAEVELLGKGLLNSDMSYEVTGIFADSTEEETKTFADENNDGYIDIINELVVGNTYTFSQKSVKSPYNRAQEFSLGVTEDIGNSSEEVVVTNRMNRVSIKLTNGDDEVLPGGEFKLLDNDGNVVQDNIVSANNLSGGKVDIAGLEPGVYTLVEKKAPVVGTINEVYYALDDSGLKFQLNNDNTVKVLSINKDALTLKNSGKANNDTKVNNLLGVAGSASKSDAAVLTYVNAPTTLQFNVNVRYNEDCNKDADAKTNMNGVTYGIYSDSECDDSDLVKEVTSDDKGLVAVYGLKQDTYYIKMLSSLGKNVVLDENVYEAKVDLASFEGLKYNNGAYVEEEELKLEVYRKDLVLQKADREDKNKMLPGSTYGLYRYSSITAKDITDGSNSSLLKGAKDNEGEWSLVSSAVTDEDGSITFSGVDVGLIYMIKEIDSPSGYQVSKDPVMVRFLRNDDGTFTLKAVDDAKGTALVSEDGNVTWYEPRLKVAVLVVDENGNPLKGTSIKLLSGNDKENIRKWTSDDTEELISGILTSGAKYTLVGTGVPDGYVLPDDVTFTVDAYPLSAGEDYTQMIKMVVRKSASNESSNVNARSFDDKVNEYNKNTKSPKTGEKGLLSYFM